MNGDYTGSMLSLAEDGGKGLVLLSGLTAEETFVNGAFGYRFPGSFGFDSLSRPREFQSTGNSLNAPSPWKQRILAG